MTQIPQRRTIRPPSGGAPKAFRQACRAASAAVLAAVLLTAPAARAHDDGMMQPVDKAMLETLMTEPLAGAPGTEVIVSRVALPPDTALPAHWHPGEEFAYVVAGGVTLFFDGKPVGEFTAGDAAKVPYQQVHHILTGDQGATIIVFRVHAQGQPERVPAN